MKQRLEWNFSETLTKETLWRIPLSLGLGCLPSLLGHETVARVSTMYRLSTGSHPYLQVSEAGLLYVITPAVVASSFVLFLFPGATIAVALGQARSAAEWIVLAFGCSLVLSIALGTVARLVFGGPLASRLLLPFWLGAAALGWAIFILRMSRGIVLTSPFVRWADLRRILWMIGIPFVGAATLVPKIFWENFNVDGIEAFEFGRSLTTHLLPYWEIQDGIFGFYHNFLLFAYPNHWFITLFGPVEAAARLPFLLYLVVLFAVLILLIEWTSVRRLSGIEEGALLLGLASYTVVQVYNTNYEPFFADIAEMAATDTLWVICFLSTCYALWTGQSGWFWVFGLMTHMASPGGLFLLAALLPATFFSPAPERGKQLMAIAQVIGVCLLMTAAYEILYNPLVVDRVNNQFSAKNMLRRLYPPSLTEFIRFNALVFPSGILPALSLLAVRRKDQASWVIAGTTVVYFAGIYLQAWTALHQFTPVMVLPLVVFWRRYLDSSRAMQMWVLPAVGLTTVLSFLLSLPRHFQINQAVREFGQATLYKVGDYERSYERSIRGGSSLSALLPANYRLQYPNQPWGTDSPSWIYYAAREKPPDTTINYVVQPASEPLPFGLERVMTRDGVSVYVRDREVWRRDRERELPRVNQSALYEPIYRRTYQFFREYVERMQQKASPTVPSASPGGLE